MKPSVLKTSTFLLLFVAGVTASELFFFRSSVAQALSPREQSARDPSLTDAFDRLIGIAREKGPIRVIVGLHLPTYKPVGELSKSERREQQIMLKQAQKELLQRFAPTDLREVRLFEFIPFLAAEADAPTLERLRGDPVISSIQPDELVPPTLAESVPLVGAPAAWTSGFTGSGWAVAILDTGVDKNHSFLSGKVVSEACYSSNFPGSSASSVCPGGVTSSTAANSGLNCNTSIAGCNHGTHVAGIAAGRGTSFSGVAKDANIVAIQVFTRIDNTATCSGFGLTTPCALVYNSDYIRGLERVLALSSSINIAAANMSLGGGQYSANCDTSFPAEKAAIDNLRSAGVATVISSGNSGFTSALGSPACISSAVNVGSTNDGSSGTITNTVSSFSNSASFLNLLAPGAVITSSVPGGGYSNFTGTSMAAPHVTGAWAVLKQRVPSASVTQILNALVSTGLPITDSRNGIVKPRIRVDAALQSLSGGGCTTVPIAPGQTVNASLATSDCSYVGTTRFVDLYTFSGAAGQRVAISMSSATFDTYLYLVNSANQIVGEDDDGGGGTNSRIPLTSGFLTLPATGTYTIHATSFFDSSTGAYSLSLVSDTGGVRRPFDFDGDGKADISVFRTSIGDWFRLNSSTNAFVGQHFGANGDRSVPADFDGDGKTDLAVFRPSSGAWFWINSSSNTLSGVSFGQNGDLPVPADYDGDGRADIAVFRPSTATWFRINSSTNQFVAASFGLSTDKPAVGDYDGDGKADICVFRPSLGDWYRLNSSNGQFVGLHFGANGDKAVPADYDGDTKTDIAVFRPSTGGWFALNSGNGALFSIQFGANGDLPSAADFDGDGRADVAVFRPSTGTWYLQRTTAGFYGQAFGTNGDMPSPNSFVY